MATEEYQWLGIALPADVMPNRVLVTPLAFFDDEAGAWHAVDGSERKQYFPRDGRVIAFDNTWLGGQPNWLYMFRPAVNQHSKLGPEAPGYAQFWIPPQPLFPAPLAQVLDWSRVATAVDLPTLLAQSDAVPAVCTQRLYLQHGESLFGPILIDEASRRPRDYLHSTAVGGQPLLVRAFQSPKHGLLQVEVPGAPLVFLDERHLDTAEREEDWSLPQVVIKRVLEASNKLPLSAGDDARLVDRRVKELARAASSEGPEALRIPLATLLRAQRLIGDQEAVLRALDTLGSTLIGLPALQPQIEAALAQEVAARSSELDARLVGQRNELEQVEAKVGDARARQEDLSRENERLQMEMTRREQELAGFERHMNDRIEALRQEPLQTLAELHIAHALLPAPAALPRDVPLDLLSQPERVTADDVAGGIWRVSAQVKTLESAEELRRQSVIAAQQGGVRSQDVRTCAAILLAGRIPVPLGNKAVAALHAVGAILTGGRVWNVPVPVTALAPLDFYGSLDTATHQFIPAAGALADIVLGARAHPDDLGLLIFEGWDRVPGMPTYVPLLRNYIEVQEHVSGAGSAPTPVNLFHPRALASQDPYVALAWFSWPPNLLIAGVLDATDAAFAIPAQCASWLVHPETEGSLDRGTQQHHETLATATSSTTWESWRQDIRQAAQAEPFKGASEEDEENKENTGGAILAAALRFWGMTSPTDVTRLIPARVGLDGHPNGHVKGQLP